MPAPGIRSRRFAYSALSSPPTCSARMVLLHTWSWERRNCPSRPMHGLKSKGWLSTKGRMSKRSMASGIAASMEALMSIQGGIWNFDGRPIEPERLADFSEFLKQQGPDGESYYADSGVALLYRSF